MTAPSVSCLPAIQRWMMAVIKHPDGVEAGLSDPSAQLEMPLSATELEQVIPRSSRQSGAQRLQIYADAYFSRLLEVLRSEYPALAYALGEELFAEFSAGYLQQHPSSAYSLSELGANFPAHLNATRPVREGNEPDWADFLIDCSRLERVYAEVFDGPGPERLPPKTACSPSPFMDVATFADWQLKLAPWVRLVALRFPVHEFASSFRRGESPEIPEAKSTWLVVSRRDFVVRRVPIAEAEFHLLELLDREASVGIALKLLVESELGSDVDAEDVRRWFAAWTASGYFNNASP